MGGLSLLDNESPIAAAYPDWDFAAFELAFKKLLGIAALAWCLRVAVVNRLLWMKWRA